MVRSKLVGLVFDSWDDLDRVLDGVTAKEATTQRDGQSTFAWTLGHVTELVDRWINVNYLGRTPHPLIASDRWRKGTDGRADDWNAIRSGTDEVRAAARDGLRELSDDQLEATFPYTGSMERFRESGLILRYALSRIVSHNYFHIGVIACQRDMLGHSVGDYPGELERAI